MVNDLSPILKNHFASCLVSGQIISTDEFLDKESKCFALFILLLLIIDPQTAEYMNQDWTNCATLQQPSHSFWIA